MDSLKKLYEEYWPQLNAEISRCISSNPEVLPTNPLLINIDEDIYREADLRIMVFGQETNDWYGPWGNLSLSQTLECYSEFFGSGAWRKYGGHFFNGVRNYHSKIKERFPDKKVSLVWNNILKIGKVKAKGAPSSQIIQATLNSFPVVKEEIRILQPNIIIFFTGPNYDRYLKDSFEYLSLNPMEGWNSRKLAKVAAKELPINSFRTYHPRYLWTDGFKRYQESILENLRF